MLHHTFNKHNILYTYANPKAILLLQTRIIMLCPNKILGKVQVRMKDRFHFCRDYCACGLLGELGVSSTYMPFFLDSCWIRIRSFWRPLGWAIWVHSPSSCIWGCFKSFFPWLKQHIHPLLSSLHKRKQINFKTLFYKNCIIILFSKSFLTCILIHIRHIRGSM